MLSGFHGEIAFISIILIPVWALVRGKKGPRKKKSDDEYGGKRLDVPVHRPPRIDMDSITNTAQPVPAEGKQKKFRG
ncbi:MAG: hypothetical protein CM15mP47_2190 [Methanobacteriota archaeon]|nr:MAG: hypothetical protein CM15mP47_2190 [Euryarchaeota archaeon]